MKKFSIMAGLLMALAFTACEQPKEELSIIPVPLKTEIQGGAFVVNEQTQLWVEAQEADKAIPCALELSRFTFWASQHPATSLPKEHRAELLSRLQPIVEYAGQLTATANAF